MAVLNRTKIPWASGFYALSPYRGCGHLCSWRGVRCWSWDMADRLWDFDFTRPEPRENIAERLRDELESREPGRVLVSNTTDPYQPIEAQHRLTRECVRLLLEGGWTVAVLTKSTIAQRDFDIYAEHPDRLWFGMTLTSPEWARKYESGAPSFGKRVWSLIEARKRGVRTWVSWEPLPPSADPRDVELALENINPRFAIFGSLNKNMMPQGRAYGGLMAELFEMSKRWDFPTFFKEEALRGLAPPHKQEILTQNRTPW